MAESFPSSENHWESISITNVVENFQRRWHITGTKIFIKLLSTSEFYEVLHKD